MYTKQLEAHNNNVLKVITMSYSEPPKYQQSHMTPHRNHVTIDTRSLQTSCEFPLQMGAIISFKRLKSDAKAPLLVRLGDSGSTIFTNEDTMIVPQGHMRIGTGIAVKIPFGTDLQVRPRSSTYPEFKVLIFNAPGTIDSNYTGELQVGLVNLGTSTIYIPKDTGIAQLVLTPVITPIWQEVVELPKTNRGSGSFGSTGKTWGEQLRTAVSDNKYNGQSR